MWLEARGSRLPWIVRVQRVGRVRVGVWNSFENRVGGRNESYIGLVCAEILGRRIAIVFPNFFGQQRTLREKLGRAYTTRAIGTGTGRIQ